MDVEAKEVESANEDQTLKKGRHRKKQLYNSILQQMEFYFSDSNLTKDRFLSQLLKENPYVELSVFLKFNKIRRLTTNIEDIQKAVKKSELIELSDDGNSIGRKKPIKEKDNVEECTIYVEHLKSDATHEWLSSVFSEFGNVVYISIPKYKHNNAIKGFAFVEFDKEEEAEKALNYFESIGCKMPSNTEPEMLCSITTFKGNNDQNNTANTESSTMKRKVGEGDENSENDDKNENVRPVTSSDISESDDAESKKKDYKEISNKKRKFEEVDEHSENEPEDTESKKKKKLKKEHKKKNYLKDLGLQVLPKKEWKKMRNRYLDLQRKKMKEFKQHLLKAKFSQANYDEKSKNPVKIVEQKIEFTEGLIVKMQLAEPTADVKKLKNEIKSFSADVMYVDIPNPGSEEVYIRFSSSDGARNFCNQEFPGKKTLLSGDEEKMYWEKIQKDRENKFKKTNKKQRGRDKLLKKAKHIKFDE